MGRWLMTSGVFLTAALLTAGLAFGQPKVDCKDRVQTPERVEGQVVSVDQNAGKVAIRDNTRAAHTSFRQTERRCRR
jgi:hypothetical protein